MRIINKIVAAVGRRIDESQPMVDARLADGSRVNAIIPPLAVDGPLVSIRKFAAIPIHMDSLVELGTRHPEMAAVLKAIVIARRNVLISGGTGSGKTTLLNALSAFIDNRERIITIEDSAELQMQQPHVGRLETRPPNIEGKGEVTQRDLVRNALRMRPDRIIVGEVRAGEAFDMLQAMNTGHDGSMTTVHANTPRDALSRIEQMIGMAGLDIPPRSAGTDRLGHQRRRPGRAPEDGRRKVVSIPRSSAWKVTSSPCRRSSASRRLATDAQGRIRGEFRATGIRPKFANELEVRGLRLFISDVQPRPGAGEGGRCSLIPCSLSTARFSLRPSC